MSKIGISLKINVSEIEKDRLFKGKKGSYLDATAFVDIDELDQYGNSGMITQDVTKEEKESGTRGRILGNSKVFWKEGGQAPQQSQQEHPNSTGGIPMPEKTQNPQPDSVDPDYFDSTIPF